MDFETGLYDISEEKLKTISATLKEITISLKERGYNPLNQLVGYLISGDPGYISNYNNCRNKIIAFDRSEILAIILAEYLGDLWDV